MLGGQLALGFPNGPKGALRFPDFLKPSAYNNIYLGNRVEVRYPGVLKGRGPNGLLKIEFQALQLTRLLLVWMTLTSHCATISNIICYQTIFMWPTAMLPLITYAKKKYIYIHIWFIDYYKCIIFLQCGEEKEETHILPLVLKNWSCEQSNLAADPSQYSQIYRAD